MSKSKEKVAESSFSPLRRSLIHGDIPAAIALMKVDQRISMFPFLPLTLANLERFFFRMEHCWMRLILMATLLSIRFLAIGRPDLCHRIMRCFASLKYMFGDQMSTATWAWEPLKARHNEILSTAFEVNKLKTNQSRYIM